jgi:hypothetical protein
MGRKLVEKSLIFNDNVFYQKNVNPSKIRALNKKTALN